jgi:hypothetical protein
MTYVINNYDGTALVSIADRTINTTRTSIKLPARDFPRYGEPVVENLIWMLQHFAAPSSPLNPIAGQIWYDTNSQSLRVYNGVSWLGTGKTVVGSTFPTSGEAGQIFYNTAKRQLFVFDPAQTPNFWRLIGPIGAFDNSDPNLPIPGHTAIEATRLSDGSLDYPVVKIVIEGQLLAIISRDAEFSPNPAISGFATIRPGINFNSLAGLNLTGNSASADVANNSLQLAGVSASTYMRRDQTNTPTSDNLFDLGSSGARYATVHASVFQGTATSARYADLAERYHADQPLKPGTVVVLGGSAEITTCVTMGSSDVFGVISSTPGLMLNSDAGSDQSHPFVALIGRTPVRVRGLVNKGQRLMASGEPGVACAWLSEFGLLAVIGRALESTTHHSESVIEAVVGVR